MSLFTLNRSLVRMFSTVSTRVITAETRGSGARCVAGLRTPCRTWSTATSRGLSRPVLACCTRVPAPTTVTAKVHTEGDEEIVKFLAEEIKYEKTNASSVPKIQNFEVVAQDGTNVELKRVFGTETITIKFNVNHTVDDESSLDFKDSPDQAEAAPPSQMVSRPPFIVEIQKGSDMTLALQCVFPLEPDTAPQEDGEFEDLLEIEEVAILKGNKKWEEAVYSMSGANMDGNLYDMLLTMMEDRGITEDFVNELVTFSTAFENNKYINFLQELQEFMSTK